MEIKWNCNTFGRFVSDSIFELELATHSEQKTYLHSTPYGIGGLPFSF